MENLFFLFIETIINYCLFFKASTNGYFSLGAKPPSSSLRRFSASSCYYSVVAPFAADMSTTQAGSVRYNTFITGDTNINTVSSDIKSKLGGSFSGTWMIVADWYNVPQYDWYKVSSRECCHI